jgi:hypothetical protein
MQFLTCNLYKTKLYTSTRPIDPLFITGNCQVFDRYYFLCKAKHVLQLIGYDPNFYNGHALDTFNMSMMI